MSFSRIVAVAIALAAAYTMTMQGQHAPARKVQAEMQNVLYHYTDRIAVRIFWLKGAVLPTQEGAVPVFDDPKSFLIAIDSAKIAIGCAALSATLNRHVFVAQDAPLKDIEISTEAQLLKVKGKLHSKGDVPFETENAVSATDDGQIRIHAQKIKAAHLPVKGLMDLLGVDISKLIDARKVQGVRVQGDDLILDPQEILPLPSIRGKVTAVQIVGDDIIQIFGAPKTATEKRRGNYMSYRGGELTFGKLTMHDSDMDLIDMDPSDPFDFFLDHYREQLSAGYTKITPAFGLRVYMRDYNKLHNQRMQR